MPDDQRPDDAPSLEAPSLGRMFGRRRGPAAEDTPGDSPGPQAPARVDPPRKTAAAPASQSEQTTLLEPTTDAPAHPQPPADAHAPSTPRPPRAALSIDGRVAAGLTGLVVGLMVVLLTAGSLRLCESIRGVSTCGGGPGFVLLVSVMVAMVLLGGSLLRLARVPDPMSTSFLAVGLTCVLALLLLVEVLDRWWMIIVIPAVTLATFLLSHWVTTSVIEPADD